MRKIISHIEYHDSQEALIGWGAVIQEESGEFRAAMDTYGYVITESLREKLDNRRYFAGIGKSQKEAVEELEKILSEIFGSKATLYEK